MKPVLSPDQMRYLESTAESHGISSEILMDEAGLKIAHAINEEVLQNGYSKKAYIFCGKGNNGGDGYVVATNLLHLGFNTVVYQIETPKSESLTRKKQLQYEQSGGTVSDHNPLSTNLSDGIIIDAVFGTGFTVDLEKPLPEKYRHIFESINKSPLITFAVDTPSGLDCSNGKYDPDVVIADHTITVEAIKHGFLFHNNCDRLGRVKVVTIGLSEYLTADLFQLQELEFSDVRSLLPPIKRSRHKYQAGYVVGIAGQPGMEGASVLSSIAALKSGAGICHLLHKATSIVKPLEIVGVPFDSVSEIAPKLAKASSIFIGPGFGETKEQKTLFSELFPFIKDKKCLFDAEALFMLKEQKALSLENAVLTPHLGELSKLLEIDTKDGMSNEIMNRCQQFVDEQTTHLLVKGQPTFLFSYNSPIHIITNADPGMATAGSGDVLSGIIASFLAQNLSPHHAMKLGAYIHALAGTLAAEAETSYAMTATSIIEALAKAFKRLMRPICK